MSCRALIIVCARRQSQSRSVTFTVSNVVRWQRQLDFFIANLTGKPCSNLEPALQAILRLGVYEVVHQNLSAHVISEHVDLAKKLVRPAAGKLVNGESAPLGHGQDDLF